MYKIIKPVNQIKMEYHRFTFGVRIFLYDWYLLFLKLLLFSQIAAHRFLEVTYDMYQTRASGLLRTNVLYHDCKH